MKKVLPVCLLLAYPVALAMSASVPLWSHPDDYGTQALRLWRSDNDTFVWVFYVPDRSRWSDKARNAWNEFGYDFTGKPVCITQVMLPYSYRVQIRRYL